MNKDTASSPHSLRGDNRPHGTGGTSRGTPRSPGGAWGWYRWLPADHRDGFASGDGLAWSRCPTTPQVAEVGCGLFIHPAASPGRLLLPVLLHKPKLPLQICTVADTTCLFAGEGLQWSVKRGI